MKGLLRTPTRVLLGAVVGGIIAAIQLGGGMSAIEELSVDWRLRLRGAQPISNEIRLVGIGDRDVGSQLGRWPFPRAVHADVLDILHAMGARHTTFDVLFTEASPDVEQDAKLKATVKKNQNTTLAYYFEDTSHEINPGTMPSFIEGHRYGLQVTGRDFISGQKPVPPIPELEATFGAVNAVPDCDGIIRSVPLFFAHEGRLYPSLAMQTVISALNLRPDQIRIEPGKEITLVDTPRGTLRIPIDRHGCYRVNFAGDLDVFTPAFQYLDLYEAVQTPDVGLKISQDLKDSIVFVGIVSTGNTDVVNSSIGRIPGVAVQATVASNILTGRHLRFLPSWAQALLPVVAGALLGLLMPGMRPWLGIGAFVLATIAWCLVTLGAARHDWILPAIPVLATFGTSALLLLGLEAATMKRDRSRIVAVLGKYFARPLLRRLIETDESVPSFSERRELTVFFSDIRGFTAWTERADPDEVTARLNEYFSAMTPLVEKHGGTLDKFIGDCIMVFFGAPVIQEDHAARAVRMAWDMQREMERLNAKWEREGHATLHIGIGIHTAYVTVGNFGSSSFVDYTVIGRGVNLASRIESFAPPGKILVSSRTHALSSEAAASRMFAELVLKGIPDVVPVYEVLSVVGFESSTTGPAPTEWWIIEGEKRTGPFTEDGITVMRQCGRISSGARVEAGQTSGAG